MPGLKDIVESYVTPQTLDAEAEGWMKEIALYQWRGLKPLETDAVALLVVDMNRPFVEEGSPLATPGARAIVPHLATIVAAFRKARRPVLWILQGHHSAEHDRGEHLSSWWPAPILENTPDIQVATGLEIAEGEKIIMKRRYSGFYQTDLELTLRCLRVSQVVIGGVFTNVCPLTTAFDAFVRDFDVYYLADGTAAATREMHVNALRSVAGWCGYVVRVGEVCEWLNG